MKGREIDIEKTAQDILDCCSRRRYYVEIEKFRKKAKNPDWLKELADELKVEVTYK